MPTANVGDTDLAAVARMFDPARLAQARRISKMSKADLHRKVGVSAAAIGQYERGEVRPEVVEHVAILADPSARAGPFGKDHRDGDSWRRIVSSLIRASAASRNALLRISESRSSSNGRNTVPILPPMAREIG